MPPTFNTTKSTDESDRTRNKAGGVAYTPATPERQLYEVVVNNMLERTYYRDDAESVKAVQRAFDACADEDPEFVLELAAHARNDMGNRDVAVLLYVLAANDDRFTPEDPGEAIGVREYGPRILRRMDEPMTALAMHDAVFGGTAPKALKKGIADAVNVMLEPDYERGAYRLGKYTLSRRDVTLYNAVNRAHVRRYAGIEDNTYKGELMTHLMEGELPEHDASPLDTPGTWENIISAEGNNAAAWRKALAGDHDGVSRGMGIMARVRNIRNMLEAGLTGEEIFGSDEIERVKNSRMFPFRLFQAYRAYQDAGLYDQHVEAFLEDAIHATVENVPDTWENTFVAIDLSGSMQSNYVSKNSTMTCADIATFFGAVMMNKGADAAAFGNDLSVVRAHHQTPALELMSKIESLQTRGMARGTNAWLVMRYLNELDRDYDRVVFLTDMQAWDNRMFSDVSVREWVDEYRDSPEDVAVYMLNLNSYGDLLTPEGYPGVYGISGWNDTIVEFVENAEDANAIIDEIRS